MIGDVAMPLFQRYIGIDYSGAQTPTSSLKGLRVYMADLEMLPVEVQPPSSPRKYWTRRVLDGWLNNKKGSHHHCCYRSPVLSSLTCFEVHHLLLTGPTFLDDFQRHWPTDNDRVPVI